MERDGSEKKPKPADVEQALAEFDLRVPTLKSLCAKTKDLLEEFLQGAGVPFQSVQARVKSRKKLREKYLDSEKGYTGLDDIHDQAGLRVITYYPDEVDRVAEMIEREFEIDRDNTVDKRKIDLDRFGYSAINYVCEHLAVRTSLGEYKKFANIRFEIQVTSILSHAWSEMNHGSYDLGESSPPQIRRRFFQLKALLELAESVFVELRNKTTEYERSVAVQVEANVSGFPLDAVSLRSFLEQEPLVRGIDERLAAVLGGRTLEEPEDRVHLWSRGANAAGLKTLQELRSALKHYKFAIIEYVERCHVYWGPVPKTLRRGLSVYQLSMLLIYGQGEQRAVELIKEFDSGLDKLKDLSAKVSVARDVLAKY